MTYFYLNKRKREPDKFTQFKQTYTGNKKKESSVKYDAFYFAGILIAIFAELAEVIYTVLAFPGTSKTIGV